MTPRGSLADLARLGDPDVAPDSTPAVPIMEREHAFVVRVGGPDGKVREATLVSHIPSVDERLKIGRTRARLAGVPWEQLDPETRVLVDAQAVLANVLNVADIPAWFVAELDANVDVLLAVYQEVSRHEAEYFRRLAEAGGAGQGAPLVSVVPVPGAALPPAEYRWENRGALGAVGGGRGGAAGAR